MSRSVTSVLPEDWVRVLDPDHPRLGLGLDPATTTERKSNPTGLALVQQVGLYYFTRLVLRLKTDDPEVISWLLRAMIVGTRERGLSIRRLCIGATNERFFATIMRRRFAGQLPVELVIESRKITYLGEDMLYKDYLGNLIANTIDDGYLPVPPQEWLKRDFRQVVRDRGSFTAEVLADGGHADCFDATALALHALKSPGGRAQAQAAPVGTWAAADKPRRPGIKNPYAARFGRRHNRHLT